MEILKTGIVGVGFIGLQHLEAVRRLGYAEVVAVADPGIKSMTDRLHGMGIRHLYTDYREMLEKQSLDVIHNCTPNALHYTINKEAIRKGLHIYSEKPLTLTSAQGEELLEMAKSYRVAHGVNFNYRNNAMVQEMRARVQSGQAGHSLLIHGQYLQDWMMYDTDYNWRIEPEQGGDSRAVADIGSHWFDTAQVIACQRIIAVNAQLVRVFDTRYKPNNATATFAAQKNERGIAVSVQNEDAACIQVRFENGLCGVLVVSQVCGGCKNDLRITLECQRYSMSWEQQKADQLLVGTRDQGEQRYYADSSWMYPAAREYASLPGGHSVAWTDALKNGINAYYRSIREERFTEDTQSYATFADGVNILRIVEACLESGRTGQWAKVKINNTEIEDKICI